MALTLATLRNRLQWAYDVAGSAVLSDDEWNQIANDAYRALWARVVGICKDWRVSSDGPFTLTTGQTRALPATYRETFAVLADPGQPQQRALPKLGYRLSMEGWQKSYRLQGSLLYIEPVGRASGTYTHLYIPDVVPLADDADLVDSELEKFEAWLVYYGADFALTREESERLYAGEFALADADVVRWASNQRSAEPDVVDDVRRRAWYGRSNAP